MSRKKKLDPIDVELTPEEFLSRLKEIGRGKGKVVHLIEHLEEEFREEGNPLAAWEALLISRKAEIPIPEWVNVYFEGSARRLFEKPPKGNNPAPAHILASLGMSTYGKGNIFSRYFAVHDREEVVKAVLRKVKEDPRKDLEQHYSAVAEEMKEKGKNISNVTIAKWFGYYRKRFLPKIYRSTPAR